MPDELDEIVAQAVKEAKYKDLLERLGLVRRKTKFGNRLIRGLTYGIGLGLIFTFAGTIFGSYITAAYSSFPFSAGLIGIMTGGAGFMLPFAIEISKEMED